MEYTMKKIALILVAAIISGASLSAPSFAQSRTDGGPYHQDRLPDGTYTGPLGNDNPNG
jgi:hypothetical protein